MTPYLGCVEGLFLRLSMTVRERAGAQLTVNTADEFLAILNQVPTHPPHRCPAKGSG